MYKSYICLDQDHGFPKNCYSLYCSGCELLILEAFEFLKDLKIPIRIPNLNRENDNYRYDFNENIIEMYFYFKKIENIEEILRRVKLKVFE